MVLSRCAEARARAMRPSVFVPPALRIVAVAALWGCSALAPSGAGAAGGGALDPLAAPPPARRAALEPVAGRALAPWPAEIGSFCLDAYSEVRAYGVDAAQPLARACEQVLGPGCDDVSGLERVTSARYVDAAGGPQSLDLVAMRFADADAAYASFTDTLIGERDPAELTARALDTRVDVVLDGQRASAWRGRYVLALDYRDETAPAARREAGARERLPASVRLLLTAVPSEPDLPLPVQKLPKEHRLPLGVRLELGDALGVRGMGAGAIGYYRDGDKRWRVLAIVRPDADAAHDVLSTLARSPAAHRIRNAPIEAFSFTERRLPAEPAVGWVVGQRQEVIYGVGDEASALPEFMPAEREAAVKLGLIDKLAKLTKVHQQ